MINFDSLTLKIFAQENLDYFLGARVQKVQQPNRSELIFTMRNKGESRKFYINFNPNFYHVCFMSKENEQKRNITIPKTAPMFCMLLRKYIQNAKITNVIVPNNERILEIYFEYFDELNERLQLCLAIELMGKHSNVILYNYDTNVIIGCAHNVSAEKSRERELSGLMPYIYPPKQNKKNLLRVTFESFEKNLDKGNIIKSVSSTYNHLTMAIVEGLYKSCEQNSIETLYAKLTQFLSQERYRYFISSDFSKYFLFEYENMVEFNTINEMIDYYFSYHQEKFIRENVRLKITRVINSKLKKLKTLLQKQQEQIQKMDKALLYKTKADVLMANMYALKSFSNTVNLYDFEGNEISIDMDTNLSVSDNANRYYSLYKKTKASFEYASQMIEDTKSQILYYEEQSFFASVCDDILELEEIYSEINEEKIVEKDKPVLIQNIEFEGFKIYIGKNKKQNDYILSKLSSAEDLWFHQLNAAGAHILVKKKNKDEIVPDEVLLKAAQITKEYSSQKLNSKTSIIYTMRKYVKKANNKLAFVTYKNESEIVV